MTVTTVARHSEGGGSPADSGAGARRRLVVLLIVAALLRVAILLAVGDRAPVIADAQDYDRLAATLVEAGAYATPSGELSSLRPPLYPAMVAGLYRLFGLHNYFAVSVAQALLSLITVVLVYKIGTELYSETLGLTAAVVIAFYPSLLAFNCLVLSETLFTCLLAGAVLASLKLVNHPSLGTAVALGVFVGLGALTRSMLWLCAVPVAAAVLLVGKGPFGRRFAAAATTIVVFAMVLAPWAVRNSRVQNTFTLVDVMGGRNVMMGNYEHTPIERSWATITDVTGERAWHKVLAAHTPGYGDLTQGQIDKKAMAYGIRYFFTHPAESAQRCVVRFFNFWQLDRTIVAGVREGLFGESSFAMTLGAAVVFCGYYATLALTALCGAIIAPPDRRSHAMLLLWIAIPCAVHTAAFAHSRYHLPLAPILAVYSASALTSLWTAPSSFLTKRGAVAGVACAVLVLGWAREVVFVDLSLLR